MSTKELCLPLVLAGLTSFSFLYLSSSVASASDDSFTDTVAIGVPMACNMTGSGMNSHTATIDSGTYEENIGTTTITTVCNDANGYAIYAIGYTGEVYGTTTLAGASGSSSIATGTATSGSTSNWAMKLTKVTNTNQSYLPANLTIENSFGSYHSVPSILTKVASYSSTTDTSLGSKLETTYRVFISSTQASDTYSGKVKYVLVHPANASAPIMPLAENLCPANKICYAPNASDIVGSMDSIGSTKITSSPTAGTQPAYSNSNYYLYPSNYSRAGYGFAGWSTDFNATNTSTIYGPSEYITTGSISSHGMILYPVWVASTGMLQGWNSCNSLTTASTATRPTLASVTALTDARDGNVYAIARLADGKCWMIENLRLNADATIGDINKSLAQGYGSYSGSGINYGSFIGLADSENDFSSGAANTIYSTDGSTIINVNPTNSPGDRIPRYNNDNINRSLAVGYDNNYQWYSYGNYYNWAAAIANTNYFNTDNTSATTTSLCPTGWRLPQGGDKTRIESNNDNDFWTLIVTNLNGGTNPANYSSSTYPYYTGTTEATPVSKLVKAFPNNFIYSGRYSNSAASSRNSGGFYRSSTTSGGNTYYLHFTGSEVYPGASRVIKIYGFSIRCIAGA
ncbi:hypothetical protein IKG33_00835 [Candidatus Saccharibacteria bacterium]|nr:hypothetical protein [Candidatus Saccharibacteria bacterium]